MKTKITSNEGKKQIAGNDTGKACSKALQLIKKDDPYAQTVIENYIITIAFEKAVGWL